MEYEFAMVKSAFHKFISIEVNHLIQKGIFFIFHIFTSFCHLGNLGISNPEARSKAIRTKVKTILNRQRILTNLVSAYGPDLEPSEIILIMLYEPIINPIIWIIDFLLSPKKEADRLSLLGGPGNGASHSDLARASAFNW